MAIRKANTVTHAAVCCLLLVTGGPGLWLLDIPEAAAQNFPTSKPLYYSGYLTDTAGKPLAAPQVVGIDLWKSETSIVSTDKVCSTPLKTLTAQDLIQGRFRIALETKCVTAFRDNPDLWVEVTVGTTKLPRTKVGAMPYVAGCDLLSGHPAFLLSSWACSTAGASRCPRSG